MNVKEFEQKAKYQNGYDRELSHWKIIDIHEIPNPILPQFETDFYCCNGKKVILLRLINSPVEKLEIVKDKSFSYPDY